MASKRPTKRRGSRRSDARANVVRRDEHQEVLDAIERNSRDLAIQMQRIAQLQVDIDLIKTKIKPD